MMSDGTPTRAPAGQPAEDSIRAEIVDLHAFFCDWFTGRLARRRVVYERLDQVLARDFELISPVGVATPRAQLLDELWRAHGSRSGGTFEIWIERYRARPVDGVSWLAVYEEWQERGDGPQGRLSSAILRRSAATPYGFAWAHVHEVWLPGAVAPTSRYASAEAVGRVRPTSR